MSLNTYSLDLESTSSQYAYITDASQTGLDLTTDFTLEAWVKIESNPGTGVNYIIDGKWATDTADQSYLFYYNNQAGVYYLSCAFRGTGGISNIDVAQTLTTGTWFHVAAVVDISVPDITLYVNAADIGGSMANTAATDINNGAAEFRVGARQSDGSYADMLVDEVRAWSDIRTGAEITDNYQTQLVGNEAGLVGYWKLNNAYTDSTSNANTLTASGSPVFSTDVPFAGTADAFTPIVGFFI